MSTAVQITDDADLCASGIATVSIQAGRSVVTAAPSGRADSSSLALQLRPDGWTDTIRLSGCTFAETLRCCAPGVWGEQADGMREHFLADPAVRQLIDQPIGGVELTLYEDGSLRRILLTGCSLELAIAFCRFVVKFDVMVANNWLNPIDEYPDEATRSGEGDR